MSLFRNRRLRSSAWAASAALAFWLGVSQDRRGVRPVAAADEPPAPVQTPGQPDEQSEVENTSRSSGVSLLVRMRTALADPVTITRQREWLRCLDEAGPAELEAGAEMLKPGLRQYRWNNFEAPALWSRWVETDSGTCVKYILKYPEVRASNTFQLYDAARRWAGSDLAAARAFLDAGRTGDLPSDALRGILQGWAAKDLTAATAYVFDPASGDAMRRPAAAQGLVLAAWESQGATGTTRWFEDMSRRPGDVTSFLQEALQSLMQNPASYENPVELMTFLKTQRGKPWWEDQAVTTIFLRMGKQEPEQCIDAIVAFGPDPQTGRYFSMGMYYAVESCTRKDPARLESWIVAHANTPVCDEVTAAYVRALRMANSTDAAERWRATIKDEKIRSEMMKR